MSSKLPEAIVLALAASLDYIIGDPRSWVHPVQMMGWMISRFTQLTIDTCNYQWQRRWAGIVLGTSLIIGCGLVSWLVIQRATQMHFLLGIGIEAVMLASCFALRSLRSAALNVLLPLQRGELSLARDRLSLYVGRDTQKLTQPEILRAVLETIAENTTDGVTAPLFYAVLGAWLPGIGSVPLAMAYKAASTLDSMIGYRQEPYTDLGWFSAKLEDKLTWLPCRLTVLTIALLSKKPQLVWRLCRRDAIKDPSPNSGWSECAFAAALGVQLGGANVYNGMVKRKPLLGEPNFAITAEKIEQALQLTRNCFLIWLGIALAGLLIEQAIAASIVTSFNLHLRF